MTEDHRTLLLTLALATACSRTPAQSAGQPGTTTSQYNPPAIIAWLDCVECTDDQLKAVAELGDQAVTHLRDVLLNGPPRDRLEQEQKHLEATYLAMKAYEHEHRDARVPLSEQEYVQLYMQKYVLLNRRRSARALGAIGTVAAQNALREAKQQANLPEELQREIDGALRLK
jgi:hypothetical protein